MSKKAIILVMSCNQERFINEEQVIKKTWGKDIIEGKCDNLKLYFFRGGAEKNYIDEKNNIIYLNCKDDLADTYDKCIACFKYIEKFLNEYDYIIRSNTSTYVNIEAIKQFLDMDDIKDDIMLGPGLAITYISQHIPYLKGHLLIIPKKIINILINNYVNKFYGYDDAVFGMVLGEFYGENYMEHLLSFDSILDIKKPYFNKLTNSFCVRIKDEENLENNIINMLGFHLLYKSGIIKTKIDPPHGFKDITTSYGNIPID